VVETTQVSETRGTDVASVWALAAVTDKVDTHLSLGGLNGGVGVAGGDGVSLGVEKEVVDESLHVLLHGGTGRGGDLVVLDADGTSRHLVQALVDDSEGLAELLHTDQVTIVAVTVSTNGNIELNLVVGIVRLALADIPGDTGTTKHGAREGQVQGISGGNNTDTTETLNPDSVVSQHLFGLVNAVTELGSPLVDVIEKTDGNILVNTTWANVGSVQTGTRDTFIEFLNHRQRTTQHIQISI
jgi:hypothetical protein